MTPVDQILAIIRLSLEITLEIMQNMPPEQKQKLWDDHLKRMAFWDKLLEALSKPLIVNP